MAVKQTNRDVSVPRYRQAALPERITKNILRRAVDVNRPVTSLARSWCDPGAVLAAQARTVTSGLTSPARLVTLEWLIGKLKT